jgi:uncharacterized protein YchJ
MKSRIEAVRLKASAVIVKVVKKAPKDWCEKFFLPEIVKAKEDISYLIRQRVINIINETVDYVSPTWQSTYAKIISSLLSDKTPNIRVLALKSICENRKLLDKNYENVIGKLKDDSDVEIKQLAK